MSHVLNPFFLAIRRLRIRNGFALLWIVVSVSALALGGIVLAGANGSVAWGKFTVGDTALVPNYYAPGNIYGSLSMTISNWRVPSRRRWSSTTVIGIPR